MNDDSLDVYSLGHAAALYQQSPRVLRVALRAVGAKCRLRVNDVQHFDADAFGEAVVWLGQHDAKQRVAKVEASVDAEYIAKRAAEPEAAE